MESSATARLSGTRTEESAGANKSLHLTGAASRCFGVQCLTGGPGR